MSDMSHQEALARVIDPDSWKLYDHKDVQGRDKVQALLVQESMETAQNIIESGLMASLEWDRREYFRALERIKAGTSLRGYCYSESDILDGRAVHDPKCTYWPDTAISGSNCIRG